MSPIACDPRTDATAPPPGVADLVSRSAAAGFHMMSDYRTGALLRTLACSKPRGVFLEIGTGTGVGTQWLLSGMCPESTLFSIEKERELQAIAARSLSADPRLRLLNVDGFAFIETVPPMSYDLIFADGEPGKYFETAKVLSLLKPGGFYVIDDLIAKDDWPTRYREKPAELVSALRAREDGIVLTLDWSTGLAVFVRTSTHQTS